MAVEVDLRHLTISLMAAAMTACGQVSSEASNTAADVNVTDEAPSGAPWPASLRVVGDGFPTKGDPCRVIGETAATVDYLDDSATLAGCPTAEQAAALGGKVVGTVDGITLVSVPRKAAIAGDGDGQGDAKVAGTNFNATADVPCSGIAGLGASCKAGVKRGPDQISVDITLPGNRTRTLLFDGKGKFVTHASAQADGSAALQSSAKREGDWQVVTVGGETYRIPDAFLLGD